jgi:hypothetical protein
MELNRAPVHFVSSTCSLVLPEKTLTEMSRAIVCTPLKDSGRRVYRRPAGSLIDSTPLILSSAFASNIRTNPPPRHTTLLAMNPYASWGNGPSNSWGSVPPPSILGALPSLQSPPLAPGQRQASPNVLSFHFTSFSPTIMNCTVVGPQSRTFYRIMSDPNGSPFCTIIREFEGQNVALIEWQPHPNVEIRGVAPKQRAQTWIGLSSDRAYATLEIHHNLTLTACGGRSRNMYVSNVGYKWTPSGNDICVRPIYNSLKPYCDIFSSSLLEPPQPRCLLVSLR